MKYEPVIGLEVHCQLQTATKIFSPEPAVFGGEANTQVDPITLGHPGTLPVLNEHVVEYAVRMGLATHCTIAPRSVFARKHYFYPDSPKGYQISQFDTPICEHGYVAFDDESGGKVVRKRISITRIHMEDDAGKSVHDQDPYATLLDYNRCGTPLIEIVSEPDLRTPHEAYLYLKTLRQLVRYLGICDGNMEEGSMRCDANISVRPVGQEAFGTKAEIKNMNSLRNVERAIEYEIERQIELLEAGGQVVQETRLWDANKLETRSMRSKEEAHDYRYFPDPDLPPVVFALEDVEQMRTRLPELPEARRARYVDEFGLPAYDAALLTEERGVAEYVEAVVAALDGHGDQAEAAKAASNVIMTNVLRVLKESDSEISRFPIEPERLAGLIILRLADQVNSSAAQQVFEVMINDDRTAQSLAEAQGLLQVSSAKVLLPVIEDVLEAHPKQVAQYQSGKHGLIGFFIGQVMRVFPGSPDPKVVRQLLAQRLTENL
ncbi:MAG: Asp-tRNA(Asn)/Glu-tRNA(Gln) amidotransferase subunit GatB [Parasphingorhabdus sp.]